MDFTISAPHQEDKFIDFIRGSFTYISDLKVLGTLLKFTNFIFCYNVQILKGKREEWVLFLEAE